MSTYFDNPIMSVASRPLNTLSSRQKRGQAFILSLMQRMNSLLSSYQQLQKSETRISRSDLYYIARSVKLFSVFLNNLSHQELGHFMTWNHYGQNANKCYSSA